MSVARLSAEFHRCFSHFEAHPDLFALDTFDLLPPLWRFQFVGPGEAFIQLRSIDQGPVDVNVVRTVPTTTGFVTEHVETQYTPAGIVTARPAPVRPRRPHLRCHDHCNGAWDDELRTRHVAKAPMVRP